MYKCSVRDCDEGVELLHYTPRPLCKEHFRISRDFSEERASIDDARSAMASGTHFCERCLETHTPSEHDRQLAEYIGKSPRCPKCKMFSLQPLSEEGGVDSTSARVEEFERRRDRYDR